MELLVTNYINMISKVCNKSDLELKKIKFGLQVIIFNLSKIFVIVCCAYILDLMQWTIVTILLSIVVKKYCFGLHAKSNRVCTVLTTIGVMLISYIGKYNLISRGYITVLALAAFIGICKYAPADTAAHPLIGKKLRAKLKKKAICSVGIIYFIAFMINRNDVTTLVVLTAFVQSLMINPLMYKLLNREWNNYEKYSNFNK